MKLGEPRTLNDPALRAQRLRDAWTNDNVRPINQWAKRLSEYRGEPGSVPLMDPTCGGIRARVLFLLEAPGRKAVSDTHGLATTGSGLLSADNDDPTAANFWQALRSADLAYSEIALWNSVPWYLGSTAKIAHPSSDDLRRARPILRELLAMLPALEVVLPLGRVAQRQWAMFQAETPGHYVTIPSWHPSPLALNQSPRHREQLVLAIRRARATLAEN